MGLVSTTFTFQNRAEENQEVTKKEKRQINICGEVTAQLGLRWVMTA
jgi:hypothetical protein